MFVKICGVTNRDDALAAVEAGARAIGFVFAPSPRRAIPDAIAEWAEDIPAGIWRVGVFVDEEPAEIERIAAQLNLDVAQLHGAETPEQHPRGIRIWRAFRVKDPQADVADYPAAEAVLIDGAAYDWSKAPGRFGRPVILAGGLHENNVLQAIERATFASFSPWAVDVSSGIEAAPGRKDHVRMKQFIKAALRT